MNETQASDAALRLLTDEVLRANAATQRDVISRMHSPAALASILTERYDCQTPTAGR